RSKVRKRRRVTKSHRVVARLEYAQTLAVVDDLGSVQANPKLSHPGGDLLGTAAMTEADQRDGLQTIQDPLPGLLVQARISTRPSSFHVGAVGIEQHQTHVSIAR